MLRVVRFAPAAGLMDVLASLDRVSGRQIAVVFPHGSPCALGNPADLSVLAEHCERRSIELTLIGGDSVLRAYAVAAGFSAATSIGEWQALDGADQPDDSMDVAGRPAFSFVPTHVAAGEDDPEGLYDPLRNDPPVFVAELREEHITHPPTARDGITQLHPVLAEWSSDAEQAKALLRAAERYEERVATRIRRTSGAAPSPEMEISRVSGSTPAESGEFRA